MRPHRRMKFRNVICMSAVAICIAFSALAQGLPNASGPEAVGFSSERLQRLTNAFQQEVDKGAIPGAVVLIARAMARLLISKPSGFRIVRNKCR